MMISHPLALYPMWFRATLERTEVAERFEGDGLLFVPSRNKQKLSLSVISARDTGSFDCGYAAPKGKDGDMEIAENRSVVATRAELGRIMDKEVFLHFLDLEVKRACRYQNFVCLLVVKLEQCSKNNGEEDGELCREIVGNLLKVEMRESDILASFGSNQLVIMLPYADKGAGNVVKSRLETSLNHYEFNKMGFEVEVQQVCFPMDGTCTKDLLRRMLAAATN